MVRDWRDEKRHERMKKKKEEEKKREWKKYLDKKERRFSLARLFE